MSCTTEVLNTSSPCTIKTFVRELHIECIDATLTFHQTIEGDVNCVVWDAAIALAKYLEEIYKKENNFLKGLNVIELGSGVGCVGLTAACLGFVTAYCVNLIFYYNFSTSCLLFTF